MSAAAMLLAAALLIGGGSRAARQRAGTPLPGRRIRRRTPGSADPFATASALDVFSVCLSAGMTVSAAAAATAHFAPAARGAYPDTAWQVGAGDADEACLALARLARRSASSGSALAEGAADLAEQVRQDVTHRAAAAAERAGVLIAGPLGLCFLPAFVCLGIVPVVAGLAGEIFGAGPL
jgi:hypothetical protein